jgi:hypothetical protein
MKKHTLLILLLCSVAAPLHAETPETQRADLRLALAKVTLYAETNKLDQAFGLIDQLKMEYPNNPQVLQAEAELNLRIGNRGEGFAALRKAMRLDPANETILDRQRAAILAQGPFIAGGYRWRSTKLANEHFARASGQTTLSPSMSAGLDVENNHLNTKQPIVRANGAVGQFNGNRQRATVTLGKIFDTGSEASGSLYASNNNLGAGGSYSWWHNKGATTLQGNLRKTNWDYIESVVGNGTKHNIRLERKQILTNRLQATLGGGFNQYNLEDDENVAQAGAWDLNVAYTFPYQLSNKPDDEVTFGLYYSIDAEYFTQVEVKNNGAPYKPLPVATYEIHSVNVSASKALSSQLYTEAYGGYAIDRLGSRGPLYGASLEYVPVDNIGIELRGARTMLGGERNNQKEDQVGLNLKYRW